MKRRGAVLEERMEARPSERGEGRLSGLIWLVVLIALAVAAWNVAPVYIDHYALKDKMNEIARAPRGTNTDEKLLDQLMRYVKENRLDRYIQRQNFKISTLETSRRITVDYTRSVDVLPGWNKTFNFNAEVDQPLIY
jgi:Domain of unknown function (DUF4845)